METSGEIIGDQRMINGCNGSVIQLSEGPEAQQGGSGKWKNTPKAYLAIAIIGAIGRAARRFAAAIVSTAAVRMMQGPECHLR